MIMKNPKVVRKVLERVTLKHTFEHVVDIIADVFENSEQMYDPDSMEATVEDYRDLTRDYQDADYGFAFNLALSKKLHKPSEIIKDYNPNHEWIHLQLDDNLGKVMLSASPIDIAIDLEDFVIAKLKEMRKQYHVLIDGYENLLAANHTVMCDRISEYRTLIEQFVDALQV